jgi:hypothetical protein
MDGPSLQTGLLELDGADESLISKAFAPDGVFGGDRFCKQQPHRI